MTLLEVFVQRWDLLKIAFMDHMFLVFVAMAFATVISVSLGIILSGARKFAEVFIGITAVLQTIPSLALLGFMIPLVGIGKTNALIALTAYALLPILRNTYTGIIEVDSAAVEAGKGMGMTRGQILRKIELPLALPIIMAGIRTATVITIGVTTLATFVGAGGLGDLIMRGIQMQNTNLILVGAIPAALLALASDFILKRIEKAATPQGLQKT